VIVAQIAYLPGVNLASGYLGAAWYASSCKLLLPADALISKPNKIHPDEAT
jgi:hypothetical protein